MWHSVEQEKVIVERQESGSWQRDVSLAAWPLAAVVAASALGQWATFPNLPWYATLMKPSFNPPNWLFGPVWTGLYALMAFAAFRISRLPASPVRRNALVLFFAQLALNAAWSWAFFAAHNPLLGLIDIVPQLLCVLATCIAFVRLDRAAGLCLVPLALWVGFATVLNAAIVVLNR
ncbi:MAG: tryptophan-rich sensory protein [Rhodopseudomonas sp.]|nr:tryptophan-rich sensory protein [Rhodopseudomonas sp.]